MNSDIVAALIPFFLLSGYVGGLYLLRKRRTASEVKPRSSFLYPTDPNSRHEITIAETYAVCSCGNWNASFAVRGPLPMWARAHLAQTTGSVFDANGWMPQ